MKLWQLEQELQKLQAFPQRKKKQREAVSLEQYVTPADICANIMFMIRSDVETKCVLDLGSGTGMLSCGAALMGAARVYGVEIDQEAMMIAETNVKEVEVEDEVCFLNLDVEVFAERIKRWKEERKDEDGDKDGGEDHKDGDKEDKDGDEKDNNIDEQTEGSEDEGSEDEGSEDGSEILETEKEPIEESLSNIIKNTDTIIMNPPFGTKVKGADMKFLLIALNLPKWKTIYSLHKSTTREYILKKMDQMGYQAEVLAEVSYNLDKFYSFHKKKSKNIAVDLIRIWK